MSRSITVIGAGSVGVSTALHLQQRGWQVTLVDRKAPGRETSYGNAGVINAGSIVPINSPAMHNKLASYLLNNKPQLRYNIKHVLKNLNWTLQFLQASKTGNTNRTAESLYALTSVSLDEHKAFMQLCGNSHRLTERGWLRVYRSGSGLDPESYEAQQLARFNIPVEAVDADGIRDLEPSLKPIYTAGSLLSGAATVNNPGALISEYAERFEADGGTMLKTGVHAISAEGERLHCVTDNDVHKCERLVIAAGPWSGDLLATLKYSLPLNVERGYHAHFSPPEGVGLNSSVYDVQSGFIMGPMEMGIRITTGVELNHRDAPPNPEQLEQVLPSIREAIDLGERTADPIWQGNRPTLPDSKPIIGKAPKHDNIWLAFGHNHIGLMTGPITGRVLAEQISGEKVCLDLKPFAPERYVK